MLNTMLAMLTVTLSACSAKEEISSSNLASRLSAEEATRIFILSLRARFSHRLSPHWIRDLA